MTPRATDWDEVHLAEDPAVELIRVMPTSIDGLTMSPALS